MVSENNRYALFKIRADERPEFVAFFFNLESAREAMKDLARHDVLDYYIRDLREDTIVDSMTHSKPQISPKPPQGLP